MNDDLHVRIDSEVKQQFITILKQMGLNPSAAVNIFIQLVVQEKALPFKTDSHISQFVDEAQTIAKNKKRGTYSKSNCVGQKFGKLTIIEETQERRNSNVVWKCQCECGAISYKTIHEVKRGACLNCAKNKKDITGQKFGKLTVIERAGSDKVQSLWRCKCECGNEIIVKMGELKVGRATSCGCSKRDTSSTKKSRRSFIPDKLLPKTEQQRMILNLYKAGKTYREIAEEMQCSHQNVASLIKTMAQSYEDSIKYE